MNRTRIGSQIVLSAAMVVALFPVVLMWLTAFKTQGELATNPFGLPQTWHLDNFVQAWTQGQFSLYLRNSVIVVVPVVGISLVLSVLAGFAFGAFRFRGQMLLFLLFLVGIMVPTEGVIVPLYYFLDDLDLINTYWGLILPQVALSTSFGAFWMRTFFAEVSSDLVDAAAVDGAALMRTLWSVLLPLAKPALLTLSVLLFMWTWNEFLLALVITQSAEIRTLPVGLALFQGRMTAQVPLLAAAATLVSAPILFVYIVLHRRFIAGLSSGAVKG